MAAAPVQNRPYRLEPGLPGVPRAFKPESDSPFRGCNFSQTQEIMYPPKVSNSPSNGYVDYSSSDDDDNENEYTYAINKANEDLEESVLDSRDEGTADNWIKRNTSMVRLTGKHPFNSEPPLTRLMHYGFITPVPLHYVRNHGPVPRVSWQDWTVEVSGLVKRQNRFTMDQLVNDFRAKEFPVTLVCAGNRRKEQTMVKKTIGFYWGAGGVSTSVWRGVPLRALLKRCGVYSRKTGGLNVCFEGAEDLPGGGGSKYGTSISKEMAMDPSRDIIIAYLQNGERLAPDHGFPVRVIIPGFIGGRMVKWLKRIIVTTEESKNYYHYKDNRVLPSHVDAELANTEGKRFIRSYDVFSHPELDEVYPPWWYKPKYIVNELNINSAITTPSHEEILPINSETTQRPYTMKGYAYSGGGKKVTRVDVTMDGGESWRVCTLEHQEKPNKYGKYWCWCFWSLEVEVLDLISAKEIAVRAWDVTLNTQPEKLLWNVMGMMNNCWFRVKINVCKPHKGEIGLIFEHPTQPGNQSGGWMAKERHLEKSIDTNSSLQKSVSTPFMNVAANKYSMSEVNKHNSAKSTWIIVHDHVYDCTRFLKDHPGGTDSILINSGTDCSEEFDAIHSDKAKKLLEDYRIGELITTSYTSDSSTSSPNNTVQSASNIIQLHRMKEIAPTRSVALVPREKVPCKLISKVSISHNVRKFRFALPYEDQVLGLPVGKHIFICATIDNKLCMRAYTPTSGVDTTGYIELVVKIYFKGVHPKFPNGGQMSQYLDSMAIGSYLHVKGPLGHIEYIGRGDFLVHGIQKFAKKLAMFAGGTGITPVYQVMQAILNDPEDDTEMYLVYTNHSEDDTLLKEKLDTWAKKYFERVKVWYVIKESIKEGWEYSIGYITESIIKDHIPRPSETTLALACGPPSMIQLTISPVLEKMGYNIKDSLLVF